MAGSLDELLRNRSRQSSEAIEAGMPDDPVNKALDREFDAQFHLPTHTENVILVALNHLRPYTNHPFKPYSDEKLNALMEDIERDGLHQPIIVRPISNSRGWEILAGHNRVEAMRRLGKSDIPAIIRDVDDDQAVLIVVSTNLKQRDKLLPSEKAFAYKLQMEALQGGENTIIANDDLTSDTNGLMRGVQIEHHRKSREVIADANSVNQIEVHRYIRLTLLLPELLNYLDQDRYPVMAGYEISFLDADAQQAVWDYFFDDGAKGKLTLKHAEAIRAAFQSGQSITVETIPAILHKPKKKPGPQSFSIPSKTLKQYAIPKDTDITALILKLLEERFGKVKTA
jgi:ParB family chromosome partitioning protein